MAPGGGILRFRPDGSRWERVSSGFRNPFDLALNEHGDLFAYRCRHGVGSRNALVSSHPDVPRRSWSGVGLAQRDWQMAGLL